MPNKYLYGVYGKLGNTVVRNAVQAGTVVVYIGLAPINLIRGYKEMNLINNPIKLTNMVNAQQISGYSGDWESFGLCEAMAAHFDNAKGNIGPIYIINVLNPEIHINPEKTEKKIIFSNGQAAIVSDRIVLDSLELDGLVEGTDYSVDYNFAKGTVLINSIGTKLTGAADATYDEVDIKMVGEDDIIGGMPEDGVYTGIGALQLLYTQENVITDIIAAPGWSDKPKVYDALCKAAIQINGHWDAYVYADIPILDETAVSIDTIIKVKEWKNSNGYCSERSKVFWPMAKDALGNKYHLSTLAAVETQRTDYSHGAVPMETCGNKSIPVAGQYFGAASANKGFDQTQAKKLTQAGISTCVFWGGSWNLWGDHTAAYQYGADIDPRCIFDVSMRMLFYVTNSFQREWGTVIDEPFTMQLKDRIINREQEKLDALVAQGALIGNPEVLFLEANNSTENMMNGNFRWDIPITPVPPLKSATVYVAYTDEGFSAYFEGEE